MWPFLSLSSRQKKSCQTSLGARNQVATNCLTGFHNGSESETWQNIYRGCHFKVSIMALGCQYCINVWYPGPQARPGHPSRTQLIVARSPEYWHCLHTQPVAPDSRPPLEYYNSLYWRYWHWVQESDLQSAVLFAWLLVRSNFTRPPRATTGHQPEGGSLGCSGNIIQLSVNNAWQWLQYEPSLQYFVYV